MKSRLLGRTTLTVSELGMGCATIGGDLYERDDREALHTLRAARDHGVTFFDTASVYGYGRSERLIGKAFHRERDRVVIATKGGVLYSSIVGALLRSRPALTSLGRLLRPFRRRFVEFKQDRRRLSFAPSDLTASVHASLRRLRTDYIDLFQLHHPTTQVMEQDDLWEALERLRAAGKIRFYGLSCDTVDDALVFLRRDDIASVQVPLSLLDQDAVTRLLPAARLKGIGVIARTPLARGLLVEDARDTLADRLTRSPEELAARRERAQNLGFLVRPDRTLAQGALRFALQQDGVSTVIVGMKTRHHLRDNLSALVAPALTEAELERVAAQKAQRPPAHDAGQR